MKFDHTFIAIRQRTLLEIYDLALHVFRVYFLQIMFLLLIGVIPWLLLDWWLIGWMLDGEYSSEYRVSLIGLINFGGQYERFFGGYERYPVGFSMLMMVLVINQAQVGTAMISHYLGQSMFIGKPSVWDTVKQLWRVPFNYYWLHYGLRMVLPVAFFAYMFKASHAGSDSIGLVVFMVIAMMIGLIVRGCRPYITKIVVLEKAPRKATESNPITFSKRSAALHLSDTGNLLGSMIVSMVFALPLSLSIYALLKVVYSALDLTWSIGFIELAVIWPVSLWITAGFFAIVRFLTYIDLRIRQEGWEVELRIRAEALKLEQTT